LGEYVTNEPNDARALSYAGAASDCEDSFSSQVDRSETVTARVSTR